MRGTQIASLVLIPMALVAVDGALLDDTKIDDTFIDSVAEQLYQRHRGHRASTVQERTFATLPPSERGKYRALVRDAIDKFKHSPLFQNRF